MISKSSILKIAITKSGVILYHDFDALKPPRARGDHWIRQIKEALLKYGFICHERRYRNHWGNCGYSGSYTHFHKPSATTKPTDFTRRIQELKNKVKALE